MAIPLLQKILVGAYVLRKHLAGERRYPLALMLEPLFRCNLACAGCGKIDYPGEILDERLSVADCLRLARASHDGLSPVGQAETLGLPQPALDVLRMTGLDRLLTRPTRLLSHGQKQALELAMVVALEPRLILLDEPTAGLTKAERTTIGTVLKALTAEGRIAAVLVEHDLDFVREISSRIVVLHQGRLVLDGTVDAVVGSELVRTIYSGGGHG